MVTWKIVNNADSGSTHVFGGDDGDNISKLFSGIDVGGTIDINTLWRFRDDKLKVRNPANTFDYIFSASAITADRTLNLPLITGTDTIAVTGLAQTFSNKVFDGTCSFSGTLDAVIVQTNQVNSMGDFDFNLLDDRLRIWNPANTFRYNIVAAAITADRQLNLPLITATDTLATKGLDNTFSVGQTVKQNNAALLKLYRQSNANAAEIQINFNAESSTSVERTFARWNGAIEDNTNGAEMGSMNLWTAHDGVLHNCMSTTGDGTFLNTPLTISPLPALGNDFLYLVRDQAVAAQFDKVSIFFDQNDSGGNRTTYAQIAGYIEDKTNGSEDGGFEINVKLAGADVNPFWITGDSAGFSNVVLQSASTFNPKLELIDEASDDGSVLNWIAWNSSSAEKLQLGIASYWDDATAGSEDGGADFSTLVNGVQKDIFGIDSASLYIGSNITLSMINPAGTFKYNITAGAISANRTLNLPVITGTDTFAVLGLAQTFLDSQTIKHASNPPLKLYRNTKVIGDASKIFFDLNDSTDVQTTYGVLSAVITDPTNTSEDGKIRLEALKAGSLVNTVEFNADALGSIDIGNNLRLRLTETNLTGQRTFTFPDTAGEVLVSERVNQNVTGAKVFSDGSIKMWNPAGTFKYVFSAAAIAADRTLNLPLITATDTLASLGLSQTFTATQTINTLAFGANGRGRPVDTLLTANRTINFSNVDATSLPHIVLNSGTTVDIASTSTETDMLNYSVPANSMGANGAVRFIITGYILQNQATGTTYTFAVKFGGTNMWADVSASLAQSASKLPFRIEGEVYNKNATNANACSVFISLNDTAAATTGIGDIADDEVQTQASGDSEGADQTKDTTSAQTLQVTVTMSVNNAATHTVVKHKMVELITT